METLVDMINRLQTLRKFLPLLLAVTIVSCAKAPDRIRKTLAPEGFEQVGVASWYGKDFHGRPTANGETYDMDGISAAHLTLPLGVWAEVTHLDTGKHVRVWVNDRGPFVKGRVIDLSRGAARKIGMIEAGVAPVRVVVSREQMQLAENRSKNRFYTLQVGSFIERDNAQRVRDQLSGKYDDVYVSKYATRRNTYHRVRVGKFKSEQGSRQVARKLEDEGFEPLLTVR